MDAAQTDPAPFGVLAHGDGALDLGCWVRGGLTVTGLADEFAGKGWEPRGKYRAILQFIMNWNNWPDHDDRAAMLDGPPPDTLSEDEKARIAAVVHCLCERDSHPLPEWMRKYRANRRGGVRLISDRPYRNRWGWASGFNRTIKKRTPRSARHYKVWFDAETLNKR